MMKKTWIAGILALVMLLCMAGCGTEEETTLTGMVVAVDGTVVSLQAFDMNMAGGFSGDRPNRPEGGEMPTMPWGMEGMEDFTMPADFNWEDYQGQMPENFEGMKPEGFDGTFPKGAERPEMPADGERPGFGGDFGNWGEAQTIDLANAHISVEVDGGKEGGSMDSITVGSYLTITLNGKGEATYVLVSTMSGFGGRDFMPLT